MLRKIFIIIVFTILSGNVFAQEMTAKEIIDKSQEIMKVDGTEMVNTLTIHDGKGNQRIRKMVSVSKLYEDGKTEKTMTRFLAPADIKGTGFLSIDYDKKDDDMWIYLPALRKSRRIVSSEKAKNFMGSEFTYSDMTSMTLEDFNYKKLKDEKVAGLDCWAVEVLPIDMDVEDENGFSKKHVFIAKNDFVVRKSLYFDFDGELLKTMSVFEIKEVDTKKHRFKVTKMEIVNNQNGRKSEIEISKINYRKETPDDYFTTRYLERE